METPQLTDEEIKAFRKMLLEQERMEWLWATIRVWVGYGAAVIAALYASWDYIIKVLHALTPTK